MMKTKILLTRKNLRSKVLLFSLIINKVMTEIPARAIVILVNDLLNSKYPMNPTVKYCQLIEDESLYYDNVYYEKINLYEIFNSICNFLSYCKEYLLNRNVYNNKII